MTDTEILELCAGNQDALRLIRGFWTFCEVWDDLVDQDKPVAPGTVNSAFVWAMFTLQENPVYRAHPGLAMALRVVISNWFAANRMEKSGDYDQTVVAYTLRCAPYDFFVAVVLAVAGPAAADAAALRFRAAPTPADSLPAYLNEHIKGV